MKKVGRRQTFVACVTAQEACDRLIRSAKAISDNQKAKLTVVSVMDTADTSGEKYQEKINALDYLRSVCSELGVEFTLLYSENPVQAVAKHIKTSRAAQIFTGEPKNGESSFVNLINAVLPKVEVTILPGARIRRSGYEADGMGKTGRNAVAFG